MHRVFRPPGKQLVLHVQDAELAITLLYELGEGASEEAMKPGTGALAQLAQGEAGREDSPVCSAEQPSMLACHISRVQQHHKLMYLRC